MSIRRLWESCTRGRCWPVDTVPLESAGVQGRTVGGRGQPGFLVQLWAGGLWDQVLRWDPHSAGQVWGDAGEFRVRRLVEEPVP